MLHVATSSFPRWPDDRAEHDDANVHNNRHSARTSNIRTRTMQADDDDDGSRIMTAAGRLPLVAPPRCSPHPEEPRHLVGFEIHVQGRPTDRPAPAQAMAHQQADHQRLVVAASSACSVDISPRCPDRRRAGPGTWRRSTPRSGSIGASGNPDGSAPEEDDADHRRARLSSNIAHTAAWKQRHGCSQQVQVGATRRLRPSDSIRASRRSAAPYASTWTGAPDTGSPCGPCPGRPTEFSKGMPEQVVAAGTRGRCRRPGEPVARCLAPAGGRRWWNIFSSGWSSQFSPARMLPGWPRTTRRRARRTAARRPRGSSRTRHHPEGAEVQREGVQLGARLPGSRGRGSARAGPSARACVGAHCSSSGYLVRRAQRFQQHRVGSKLITGPVALSGISRSCSSTSHLVPSGRPPRARVLVDRPGGRSRWIGANAHHAGRGRARQVLGRASRGRNL